MEFGFHTTYTDIPYAREGFHEDFSLLLRSPSPRIQWCGESTVDKLHPSVVPIDVDDAILSEATADLIETFKSQFPDMDPQTISKVVQNASDVFKHSNAKGIFPSRSQSNRGINDSKSNLDRRAHCNGTLGVPSRKRKCPIIS